MSQSNGLIQLTGAESRYIGYYVAAILAVLGLFPIIGGVLNTLPQSVLGGATITPQPSSPALLPWEKGARFKFPLFQEREFGRERVGTLSLSIRC